MASKVCGFEIGKKLCEAMGLDAKYVRSIDIHVKADSLVTATVEHIVNADQAQSLINVLSAYTLRHEKEIGRKEVPAEGDKLMRFFKGTE